MQLSRRALLIAAGGVALAGCQSNRTGPAAPRDGDRVAVEAALASERALVAGYDLAIARLDAVAAVPLVRERARHAAHITALESVRPALTPSAPPIATAPDRSLRASLRESVAALQSAAVAAADGSTAALLASIAAEHAADSATRRDA